MTTPPEGDDSGATAGSPGGPLDARRLNFERLRDMRRGLEALDASMAATGEGAAEADDDLDYGDGIPWPEDRDAPGAPLLADALVIGWSLADIDRLKAERDSFLGDLQRVGAEFANYRRQADRRIEEAAERKLIQLVEKVLPALDALDSAVLQGNVEVDPIRVVLLSALEKDGLEKLVPLDEPFDPTRHDAVMREDGGDDAEIVVVDVLRAGYLWRGQVVRAAMVKVRG